MSDNPRNFFICSFNTINNSKKIVRKLTPKECSRLQTVPDNYCIMGNFDGVVKPVSKSQQYKMLGNGWTTAVIEHIFKGVEA